MRGLARAVCGAGGVGKEQGDMQKAEVSRGPGREAGQRRAGSGFEEQGASSWLTGPELRQ